jgi:hypothetical protein
VCVCVCVRACVLPATTSTPTQASTQDTSNPCIIQRHTKQPQYEPHAATPTSASLLQPYAARQQNIITVHTHMLEKIYSNCYNHLYLLPSQQTRNQEVTETVLAPCACVWAVHVSSSDFISLGRYEHLSHKRYSNRNVCTPKPYTEYTLLLNVMSVKATHAYNTLAFSLQESAAVLNIRKKNHKHVLSER